MDETAGSDFKKIKYSLKLNCTYRELVDWIQQEHPSFMISTVDDNTFDLYLPSEEFRQGVHSILPKTEPRKALELLSFSFMRFEVLNEIPFTLEATHYYVAENLPEIQKFSKLIAWAKRIFGQVEEQQDGAVKSENQRTGKYDNLCILWVNRPSIPRQNRDDFLDEHASELTLKDFERVLKDAYKRKIIDKSPGKNGRYKPKPFA